VRRDDGSAARLGYSRFSPTLLSHVSLSLPSTFFAHFSTLSFVLYIEFYIPGLELILFRVRLLFHTHTHTDRARHFCISLYISFNLRFCLFCAPAIIYILFPLTVLEEFDLRIHQLADSFYLLFFSSHSHSRCSSRIETRCESAAGDAPI